MAHAWQRFRDVDGPAPSWSMKVRDVVRLLRDDGWYLVRVRGSHARYAHAEKKTLVTVPGQGGDDLAPKTLRSILRQAGLRYPFRVEDE